jgi:MscS family membrane protein
MENLLSSIELQVENGKHFAWASQVFVVVFLTLVASYASNRVLKRLESKLKKTKSVWDESVIHALLVPLKVMIWLVGITFAVEIVDYDNKLAIFQIAEPLRDVGIIACITWFVLRFIKETEKNLMVKADSAESSLDRSTVDAIIKLLRIAVFITGGLIILQTLGFSVSGVLAFGGVGGIAIGFAAKDLLSNFFGAMMIYLDRPFAIGDWIRSPDRDIEGTVEAIGWRQTRIRTFDKRPLYVPNSIFSTIAVENPARMTHRRIYETIGVRYDDVAALPKILKDIKDMLTKHKEIDENQTLMVNFNEFNSSSVDFFIYTFTHTTSWQEFHRIKEDVLFKISDIIAKHKAEIAFPTSTLHVPDPIRMVGAK